MFPVSLIDVGVDIDIDVRVSAKKSARNSFRTLPTSARSTYVPATDPEITDQGTDLSTIDRSADRYQHIHPQREEESDTHSDRVSLGREVEKQRGRKEKNRTRDDTQSPSSQSGRGRRRLIESSGVCLGRVSRVGRVGSSRAYLLPFYVG
jgi:hypothetical protein